MAPRMTTRSATAPVPRSLSVEARNFSPYKMDFRIRFNLPLRKYKMRRKEHLVCRGLCLPSKNRKSLPTPNGVLAIAENKSVPVHAWSLGILCLFVDALVVAILVKATYQSWLLLMRAGGVVQRLCAQSWFLCRRLLLVYLRRESTPPRKRGSRSAMLQVSSHGSPCRARAYRSHPCGRSPTPSQGPGLCTSLLVAGHIPEGETQRDLTALEVGLVAMVRRIARLHLGLTAQDEVAAAAPPPGGGLGFGGAQAEDVGAGSAAARATNAEPRLELSVILVPAFNSELARLPQAKVQDLFTSDCTLRGHRATRSSWPTWCPLRISHCSVLLVRDCCTSSRTSLGPSFPMSLGSGRNYLDRPPSSVGGLVQGLPLYALAVGGGTSWDP